VNCGQWSPDQSFTCPRYYFARHLFPSKSGFKPKVDTVLGATRVVFFGRQPLPVHFPAPEKLPKARQISRIVP